MDKLRILVADDEAIPAYAGSGEAHAVRKLERRMRFFAAMRRRNKPWFNQMLLESAIFLVVSMVFVYRSFYGMRIGDTGASKAKAEPAEKKPAAKADKAEKAEKKAEPKKAEKKPEPKAESKKSSDDDEEDEDEDEDDADEKAEAKGDKKSDDKSDKKSDDKKSKEKEADA